MLTRFIRTTSLTLLALAAGGCSSLGGSFLIFGGGSDVPHGDLVERAHAAEHETQELRRDFAAAFLLYQRLTAPQAVQLQQLSEEFEDAVDSCQNRAEDLSDRVESIRRETESLVENWTEELARFSSEAVRKKSEAQMRDTEAHAQRLQAALERLQGRTQPVLLKLQDYKLFFEHNLNARAIATLQDTYRDFDSEFKALESEVGKTQTEISAFLTHFTESQPAQAAVAQAAPLAQTKPAK